MKIKNRRRKRSHRLEGIGVGRIRTAPFSSDSAYDSDAYDPVKTRLSEWQAEAQEPTNHNASSQALLGQLDSKKKFLLDRKRPSRKRHRYHFLLIPRV